MSKIFHVCTHIILKTNTFQWFRLGCSNTTEVWTTIASIHHRRCMHTASVLTDGKVLVAGGFTSDLFVSYNKCKWVINELV